MTETLIIFTRYPEPGKTKTRMIPVLGAEGAAKLQRQLTEHTVKQAQLLQQSRQINIEVHFSVSDVAKSNMNEYDLMKSWLGNNLSYYPQIGDDLGDKMHSSMMDVFQRNSNRVIIIGIDCPDIDCLILEQACESLKKHDLVLGPAQDGGYYLIGLSSFIPELFINIDWGTSSVLTQTQDIAQKLGLSQHYLPILADIDRPEDLEIARRHNHM